LIEPIKLSEKYDSLTWEEFLIHTYNQYDEEYKELNEIEQMIQRGKQDLNSINYFSPEVDTSVCDFMEVDYESRKTSNASYHLEHRTSISSQHHLILPTSKTASVSITNSPTNQSSTHSLTNHSSQNVVKKNTAVLSSITIDLNKNMKIKVNRTRAGVKSDTLVIPKTKPIK
jgi:hypothetical protein